MTWVEWIKTISAFRYGVHLMPTQAAGTFTLNCAYWGIPCIGYKGLDTQHLHPSLTVDFGDLQSARELANKLKNDEDFYNKCSEECKDGFKNSAFNENNYIYYMNKVIDEVMNETN